MKLTYRRKGDYLYPNLTLETAETQAPLGKYGLMRRSFLKENRPGWYQSMLLTGQLEEHLREIDRTAQQRIERILETLIQRNPAPDKEADQMGWVCHMNRLTAMAEESVLNELVYG